MQQYLLISLLAAVSASLSPDCYNTPTSEGWITLQEGRFACAALQGNQKEKDLGKYYILCTHGHYVVMPCPPYLRWDTSINACNYPENVKCGLPNMDRSYTFSDDDITSDTRTSTTQREIAPTTVHTPMNRTEQIEIAQKNDCLDATTSEGPRTLQHGESACAPLKNGEMNSDLGRRFIICSSGTVFTQACSPGLRYDTATGTCNWPQSATCALPNNNNPSRSTSKSTYATTTTTVRSTSKSEYTTTIPVRSTDRSTTFPTTTPRTTKRPITTSSPLANGPCNAANCKLPNCFCFGDSPTTIPLADMPMFLMLTFDDAVTTSLYNSYYRALMVGNDYKLFNPSGCRTRSTLYVSHENTDYSKVKAAWEAGNEIGSHTIHHQLPQGDKSSDYPQMVDEIQGLRNEMLKAIGNLSLVDSIIGFRAPYLRVAGDVQFDVLQDYGFLYDTSVLNINILQGKEPHWPFTLDHVMLECVNPPCPTKAYPGLWEVPLNGWIGDDRSGCSMVDACIVGQSPWSATEEQWYNFYNRNFQDYFYPIKVPMPIFTHGSMFTNFPNSYPALASWLQDLLLTRKDVWLVTPTQVIEWMRNPLSNRDMIAQRWGC